ncbi:hypothetical protein IV203_019472 [Nitzschia inconspicua]|uniref:Histone H3-K79 methyltransferase n=1 Tax=Nitzschia inconspicua TaxID=303405 RepID=A0A9K3Q4B4_9STRA|nr:hypothetical protein IV203_019472 [Nitzschia inconspicua]
MSRMEINSRGVMSRVMVVISLYLLLSTFHVCHFLVASLVSRAQSKFPLRRYHPSGLSRKSATSSWNVPSRLDHTDAQAVLEAVFPSRQYGDRIALGRQAQDVSGGAAFAADDPRLSMTYAEFPLPSLDSLLDAALKQYDAWNKNDDVDRDSIRLVDVGSGMGRIVLYAALSRGSSECPWHVGGIEISPKLHESAVLLMEQAVQHGALAAVTDDTAGGNTVLLHLGSAQDSASLLSKAHIIFAYSTVFTAKTFSPELSALLLDAEWSEMLGRTCRQGSVVITTDRALDPKYGWKLLDRINVTNPEVFESTGFIHVLERRQDEK